MKIKDAKQILGIFLIPPV